MCFPSTTAYIADFFNKYNAFYVITLKVIKWEIELMYISDQITSKVWSMSLGGHKTEEPLATKDVIEEEEATRETTSK